MTLTADFVRRRFFYNPDTGKLHHYRMSKIGEPVGTLNGRYLIARIEGKNYYIHRLAWLYMFGKWPIAIDHVNGKGTDNRLINIRQATARQNAFNRKIYINNRTGLKGVVHKAGPKFCKLRPWHATIKIYGKAKTIGAYSTPEQAHEAYCTAAKELFGEEFFRRV